MKVVAGLALFLLFSLPSVQAQTNHIAPCYRYPLRTFGGNASMSLKPLFDWWKLHGGTNVVPASPDAEINSDRPLSAWKRITGTKVVVAGYDWVLEAQVATSPAERTNEEIILKNPPFAEEQQFYALQALVAQYAQKITNDAKAYQTAVTKENDSKQQADASAISPNVWNRMQVGKYDQREKRDKAAAEAALADQKKYIEARVAIQNQLAAIPSINGKYQVDLFAAEIGHTKQGLPIFDTGAAYINAMNPSPQ